MQTTVQHEGSGVWGTHPNYDDIARFEYGRRFWRDPKSRACLLAHWLDHRHPQCERFVEQRALVEAVLSSPKSESELDAELRRDGTSLCHAVREIPPVVGSFFHW